MSRRTDLPQGLDAGACGAGTPVVDRPATIVISWGRTYETQNYRADVLRAWLERGDFADHERVLVWKHVGILRWRRIVPFAVKPKDIRRVIEQ